MHPDRLLAHLNTPEGNRAPDDTPDETLLFNVGIGEIGLDDQQLARMTQIMGIK